MGITRATHCRAWLTQQQGVYYSTRATYPQPEQVCNVLDRFISAIDHKLEERKEEMEYIKGYTDLNRAGEFSKGADWTLYTMTPPGSEFVSHLVFS